MTTGREAEMISAGKSVLGIELGSTRIKACLIDPADASVVATGSFDWENEYVDGSWTYSLESVWWGLQAAYSNLVASVEREFAVSPARFEAIGISAMMHGYLPFDEHSEQLVPFRTWRNTSTGRAAGELTQLFDVNIPLRWTIAHLHQAVLDGEPHVSRVRFVTTLAGYVHWKLTGRKVIGVGDASGMFPIDVTTGTYDAELLARYERLVANGSLAVLPKDVLPEVLPAGSAAGELTAEGSRLLDPSGKLLPGIPLAPPEGDAGTGMVATNAIAPRTGNVSAGTSIFAMVVLERELTRVHTEIDVVLTPAGDPVAMVHCNNGASELAAWVRMFARFAEAAGVSLDPDEVYGILFREALRGAPDAAGVLAYNQVAGEPIAGIDAGRPLVVRTPDSGLELADVMRSQLYGVFATLALGMRVLWDEGVELDVMHAHGGIFRTAEVAQQFLAAALDVSVSTTTTAAEGGAWGMAVLAAYSVSGSSISLSEYLRNVVFAGTHLVVATPKPQDVAGFADYLERYRDGLDVVRAASVALKERTNQ